MSTSHPDELSLIERAAQGDDVAVSHLLLWYHDALRDRVDTWLHAEDRRRFDPEDILQEVYANAFQAIASFIPQGEGAFFGWLMTIAQRALVDVRRRQQAQKRSGTMRRVDMVAGTKTESIVQLIDILSAPMPTPSAQAAKDEAVAALRAAIALLAPHAQQVVELKCQGMSEGEIAGQLNMTTNAVRGVCQRARRQLAELLGSASLYFDSS